MSEESTFILMSDLVAALFFISMTFFALFVHAESAHTENEIAVEDNNGSGNEPPIQIEITSDGFILEGETLDCSALQDKAHEQKIQFFISQKTQLKAAAAGGVGKLTSEGFRCVGVEAGYVFE